MGLKVKGHHDRPVRKRKTTVISDHVVWSSCVASVESERAPQLHNNYEGKKRED